MLFIMQKVGCYNPSTSYQWSQHEYRTKHMDVETQDHTLIMQGLSALLAGGRVLGLGWRWGGGVDGGEVLLCIVLRLRKK